MGWAKGCAAAQGDSMFKLFQSIMPKENSFFDLFDRHALTLVGGAQVMSRMFAHEQPIAEACGQISDFENNADNVTRDVLHAVRRTFITPFDRSAITDLISSMDDAIDEMQKTAKAITQFEVTHFEPEMCKMAALAEQAAQLVLEAVALLRSVGRNHEALDKITEQIVHIEEAADDLHDVGMKTLFQRHRDGNAMGYIVGREIYSHLEKVLDRFEDVANEISGIVIDHA
jgi:predicted phosphate transport protein (TIGR00153 family)